MKFNFMPSSSINRIDLKTQEKITRDRLTSQDVFSWKAFFVQIFVGTIGILIMFFTEPIVSQFKPDGGNSPLVFWAYLIGIALIVVGWFAISDLIKKLLKL